jgi:exopolyphosphatase/guanosine-5'-triphosphate,3'-diphosphate pyrophosphatase
MRKSDQPDLNIPNTSWRVSVIDLGYNSLKMVSYEVRPDGSFRAYNQRGELTKIGEGLDGTGKLGRDGIKRTLRVLMFLNETNRIEKVDKVLAVATSAVREARNGLNFVRRAQSATNVKFRILSRSEEALYSYVGGAKATNFPTVLFFDLGGGSLELTYARERKIKKVLSLPLGALRLAETYGIKDGNYSKGDYERLKIRIDRLLPARSKLNLDEETVLIGAGGTVRALARYDQWKNGYQLNKVHNYILRRKSVVESHKELRVMTLEDISRLDSFGRDRAESVATGSLIIAMLMDRLGFSELTVSTHGLRDGILTEYLKDPTSYASRKFDVEKAEKILDEPQVNDPKTSIVQTLFFKGLLNKTEESILREAIGSFMDVYLTTRPETLFYSIISLDSVLNHKEQLAAAIVLVRAKSPKMARWYMEYYSPILQDIKRSSIYKMAAVVVLEEILYRTGSKARIEIRQNEVVIKIESVMGKAFPKLLLKEALEDIERSMRKRIRLTVGNYRSEERY